MIDTSIAVIIPMFNSSHTIERALRSLLNQRVAPDEIIIIDDCSTDDSIKVVEAFIERHACHRAILLHMPTNSGPGAARNRGWDKANSRYIAFLDADDAWSSEYIERKKRILAEYPDLKLLSNNVEIVMSENKIPAYTFNQNMLHFPSNSEVLRSNVFSTSSVLLQKDSVYRFPLQKYSEDYALWLDVVFNSNKKTIAIMPDILTFTFKEYYGRSGLSSKLWAMEKFELLNYYRIWRKKYINVIQWLLISAYSFAKYLRRVLLTFMRRYL